LFLPFRERNRLTSGYRLPERPDHNGIDLVGEDNPVVYSPVEGIVKTSAAALPKSSQNATWEWGNYVRIDDLEGNRLYFCHLASRSVKEGMQIKAGDPIGVMGNTGYSFGTHLHFEVRKSDNRNWINPAIYLGIPNKVGTYRSPNGWIKENGVWHWYDLGQMQKNMWVRTGNWWYRLGEDGAMLTGLHRIDGNLYYLNENNRMQIPSGACLITNEKGSILE
jgi:hypothetical protein